MSAAKDGVKVCPRCDRLKPVAEFYPSKSRADGYYAYCIPCTKDENRESHNKRKAKSPRKVTVEEKLCPDCGETKPAGAFYVSRFVGSDGLSYSCKECVKQRVKEHTRETQFTEPVRREDGLKLCPNCNTEKPFEDFGVNRSRKDHLNVWCKKCGKRPGFNRYLLHAYNITADDFDRMQREQSARCFICHQKETHIHMGRVGRLQVDHDPDNPEPNARDLLCNRCNHAMSGLQILVKAGLVEAGLAYLRRWGVNVK